MKKVFVSGCYDMLHSGHVAFFEEAASYGELYVGLGSDRTIRDLKGRSTINTEAERLYMVKSLRCVKDAWINSGSGLMDFEKEVHELKPDIFFVNTDGFTPAKEVFCREFGIELVVGKRLPHAGLPPRSTTSLRSECTIPYRVELCGGWLDQPFVNELVPGPVITVSIEPDCDFNDRSGMATSSRKKAIEMWHTCLPLGNREALAKTLFCVDNPPGTKTVSGSQDSLGLLMPGVNKLNYDRGYWPKSIDTVTDEKILSFMEKHLWLMPLPPRRSEYDVFAHCNVTASGAAKLAAAAERCWRAIMACDAQSWGRATADCFDAQLEMFPDMATREVLECAASFRDRAYGWKLTGAGGGGYLILISADPVKNAIQVRPCRS